MEVLAFKNKETKDKLGRSENYPLALLSAQELWDDERRMMLETLRWRKGPPMEKKMLAITEDLQDRSGEREREEALNATGAEMKAEQGCTQVWLLSKSLEKG